jgi:hydantoinase/carbamoylase family amidase
MLTENTKIAGMAAKKALPRPKSTLNPKRTVAELLALREQTSTPDPRSPWGGAMRVAWTDTWLQSRQWLRDQVAGLPLEIHNDEAGNTWYTLKGKRKDALLIGGHMDSVPLGGWLDGCLNVMAGIEVLRRIHDEYQGAPPVTVRVVDWADEEGARFGRSLLGSSACAGTMDPAVERNRKDKDGITIETALQRCGVNIDHAHKSGKELKNARAYLELHIEQGPVLERRKEVLGTVIGTCGVERWAIKFTGQTAHSGSTPMDVRRDALACAARLELEIREIAKKHGGVCTIGSVITKPGIVTAIVGECDVTLDQRHINAKSLAAMYREAVAASKRFAKEEGCTVQWKNIWQIEPILFHKTLLDFCDQANIEISGKTHRLPSGPLHDAAEISRAGVPTVMMYVQSLHGISHNPIEDTKTAHIEACVRALDQLADKTMQWIIAGA